jgi:DNA-binding MarR family transcriptional regulator
VLERENESQLDREHYAAIATFRYELRRFLAFSEAAASAEGLPSQQHQALLVIAGHQSPEPPTVGTISDRLVIAPHTAAELVSRMEKADLLTKAPAVHDRRLVELALTPQARKLLDRLTAAHLKELTVLKPALARALRRLGRAPS